MYLIAKFAYFEAGENGLICVLSPSYVFLLMFDHSKKRKFACKHEKSIKLKRHGMNENNRFKICVLLLITDVVKFIFCLKD